MLVTYVAMAVIFTAIVLGVIWFIRRMSLSRVLRLGMGDVSTTELGNHNTLPSAK